MKLEEIVKDRIRERLEVVGLSAAAASVEAGLGKSAIQSILSGASGSPRLTTLFQLAKPLKCSLAYLTGSTDDPSNFNDAPMARSISEFPSNAITLSESVRIIGRDFSEYEQSDAYIPADDRLAVRDVRFPTVPVEVFLVDTERHHEEGISRGDLVTAITGLSENTIAVQAEAWLITRTMRKIDGAFRLDLEIVSISPTHIRIGEWALGRDDFAEHLQHIVHPMGRMVLVKNDEFDVDPHHRIRLEGLMIRSLRPWKRKDSY